MKFRAILFTATAFSILFAGYLYNKYRIAPAIVFSDLKLVTLDGQRVGLQDYESRYMLICFSATWCGPCMQEIPSLIKAQELLAEKDVAVVLISDESETAANAIRYKTGENIPVLRTQQSFRDLKIATLPTTYLLNERREIIFKKTGAQNWASPEVVKQLNQLLE